MKTKIFRTIYKLRYQLYDNKFYFLADILDGIICSKYFSKEQEEFN